VLEGLGWGRPLITLPSGITNVQTASTKPNSGAAISKMRLGLKGSSPLSVGSSLDRLVAAWLLARWSGARADPLVRGGGSESMQGFELKTRYQLI
jgi:hypothetical protein